MAIILTLNDFRSVLGKENVELRLALVRAIDAWRRGSWAGRLTKGNAAE